LPRGPAKIADFTDMALPAVDLFENCTPPSMFRMTALPAVDLLFEIGKRRRDFVPLRFPLDCLFPS
jgi:hypothetical protein